MNAPGRQQETAIRGILFDLWNTLAFTDATPNPVRTLAEAFGLHTEPDWRKQIERAMMRRRLSGISEAIDAIARATGRSLTGRWTRHDLILMWGEASNHNRLYPDALSALRSLRGRPARRPARERLIVGILSNTQSFDLDFMQREGLTSLVDDVCLSCDCGLLKPDARIYAHAARRLKLPPEQVLMVGDNPADDLEGARGAGMQARLLDRGGRTDGAVASLTDLAAGLTF